MLLLLLLFDSIPIIVIIDFPPFNSQQNAKRSTHTNNLCTSPKIIYPCACVCVCVYPLDPSMWSHIKDSITKF